MSDEPFDWTPRPKPPAVIVDLDETLCRQGDCPVADGVELLRRLRGVTVHYVTARPEASRRFTEDFLAEHRLPGWRNLHFCPDWMTVKRHKHDATARIAREYRVLASIGDSDEEEHAAREHGVPFVRVAVGDEAPAWRELAHLLGDLVLSPKDE